MALRNMCRCAARVVERDFAVVPTRAILPSTLFRGLSYNRGDSWVGQDAGGRGQDYNSGVSGRGAKGSYGGRNAANWRDGDWECDECGHHVFASRSVCPRCQAEKPYSEGSHVPGSSSSGGKGNMMGRGGDYQARQSPEHKLGDWNCPECDFHNFASRQECFRCRLARTPDVKVVGQDDGEWRGGQDVGRDRGGGDGGWSGGGGDAFGSKQPLKQLRGDWNCPECDFHNFASRTECFRCRLPLTADIELVDSNDSGWSGAAGMGGGSGHASDYRN